MEKHPAPYDSNANGAVGNAVEHVQGLTRTFKIELERAISKTIPLDHPVVSRMVEHGAFIPTTRRVKSNGSAAYQHLRGRQFIKSHMCFGGRCHCKLRAKAQFDKNPENPSRDVNDAPS